MLREFPRTAIERSVSFAKCAAIRFRDFEHTKPILVYQMGKVGSLSVYSALKRACRDRSVYHSHFLTPDGWQKAAKYYASQNVPRLPEHMYVSRELIRKLSRSNCRWTVVTLVRDPIARDISGYFQHIRYRYPNIEMSLPGTVETCLRDLKVRFASWDPKFDYTSTWLEREPGRAFEFDIYSEPFDHQRAFSVIKSPRADMLIFESSQLTQTFEVAVRTTLGITLRTDFHSCNVTLDTPYGELYRKTVSKFRIPRALCEQIYSTRFARHFFPPEKLAVLTDRWAEK